MLIFEMLAGRPAFSNPSHSMNVTYWRVLEATVVMPQWVSADAADLMHRLLDKDPATRLGSQGGCGPTTLVCVLARVHRARAFGASAPALQLSLRL
jgi:hypothetical protein